MAVRQDLYEREVTRFREDIKKDAAAAVRHYGISLLHSLSPDERAQALRTLGAELVLAEDFCNLGIAAAKDGNFAEAAGLFKTAAEKSSSMTDAIYNMAYCYEKAGMLPQATAAWNTYAETLPTGQDKLDVKKHASELGK